MKKPPLMQQLLKYVWPAPLKLSKADHPPMGGLFLKGLVVLLAQLTIMLPLGIALFKALGMGLGLVVLVPLGLFAEVLAGAIILIWYHRSIRQQFNFKIAGTIVPTIPLRSALKVSWACGWRMWFIKMLVMGFAAIILVGLSYVAPINAPALIMSEAFNKSFMKYDLVMAMFGLWVFLPYIHKIYPAYHFAKVTK